MIERYTKPAMGKIWNVESRFEYMLIVEKALANVQAESGIIPKKDAKKIQSAKINVDRINEIEKTTRHDVIAFVSCAAESVGDSGRYIHYGMTSSDILDTALGVQIKEAAAIIEKDFKELEAALKKACTQYSQHLCAGRTHGMHAETTSLGYKLAGYFVELKRQKERVLRALKQAQVGKISGAVGTYSSSPKNIENKLCKKLGLQPETVATQVVPRDRLAEVLSSFANLGGFFERISVELRHLQRTEVAEVFEGFRKGQKGSSAMPHKKNPISAENLTGMSRLLRGYALTAFENQALWHERDISHSSVERVMLPDSFILVDYSLQRLKELIESLQVDQDRMLENMQLSKGRLMSSQVLLALVDKGLSREDAYSLVQSAALKDGGRAELKEELLSNKDVMKKLSEKEINEIFSGKKLKAHFKKLVAEVLK